MTSLSDVSASPSSPPAAPPVPHHFLLSITSRAGLCSNPCRQLDGIETHPCPGTGVSREPPPAEVLQGEPQGSCCGMSLEIEACPLGMRWGVPGSAERSLFWAMPRDLGSTGRGCPGAQLPLRVLLAGTASHDPGWLYPPSGKFLLPVGNVLLPLFWSSSLRTRPAQEIIGVDRGLAANWGFARASMIFAIKGRWEGDGGGGGDSTRV